MQIFISLAMMVISYLIQQAMAPKPSEPVAGQLDVPVASEGGEQSVVFGTVLIKDSNVVWYGDSSTKPIRSRGGKK